MINPPIIKSQPVEEAKPQANAQIMKQSSSKQKVHEPATPVEPVKTVAPVELVKLVEPVFRPLKMLK